jgi:hypothetical protein
MSTSSPFSRLAGVRRRAGLLLAPLALLACACSGENAAAPLTPTAVPLAAKAAPGVTVASTSPRYGDRGSTLDVRITGTGFATGAQATWLLRGVADPAKVRTNSTTYVSATEVVANITISGDADLSYWDVQIMAGGKNGVGTEAFEVTSAEVLGTAGSVGGMSDAGQVVGTTAGNAYVYDDSFGMLTLGAGQGEGIDPLGTMVFGRDGANWPTAWVRQGATTTYVAELLPRLATAIGGNAVTAARDATDALLVGGWQILPARKGTPGQNRPVFWRRGAGWSAPIAMSLPAGSTAGALRGINGRGQAVGRLDAASYGAIWEDSATVTRLDGLPSGINAAGTLAVGQLGGQPAFWYRTAAGAWRTTGTVLPSIAGSCGGDAVSVNDDGVIVGKSCDGSGKLQASLWRLDLSGATPALLAGPQRLPGLGVKATTGNETTIAAAVSGTAPYVVVGVASTTGNTFAAVRWRTW